MMNNSLWQPQIAIIRYIDSTQAREESKTIKTKIDDSDFTELKIFLQNTINMIRAARRQTHSRYPFFFKQ